MNPLPLDRPALTRAIAEGRSFGYRLFYGHHVEKSGRLTDSVFSQWYPAPFEVRGVTYPTAEHWMMAGKARVFGDDEALQAILEAPTPAAAKALGRQVRGFDEARWAARRVEVVSEGNVHKFGADPERRAYLLTTGDAILVEASPRDRIWGIGLGAEHPHARDPERWRGQNLLGFALIAAREKLRASA